MLDTDQLKYGLFRFLDNDLNIELSQMPSREEFDALQKKMSLFITPKPDDLGGINMGDVKDKPADAEVTIKLRSPEGDMLRMGLTLLKFLGYVSKKKPETWNADKEF